MIRFGKPNPVDQFVAHYDSKAAELAGTPGAKIFNQVWGQLKERDVFSGDIRRSSKRLGGFDRQAYYRAQNRVQEESGLGIKLVKMAMADGDLHPSERQAFQALMSKMQVLDATPLTYREYWNGPNLLMAAPTAELRQWTADHIEGELTSEGVKKLFPHLIPRDGTDFVQNLKARNQFLDAVKTAFQGRITDEAATLLTVLNQSSWLTDHRKPQFSGKHDNRTTAVLLDYTRDSVERHAYLDGIALLRSTLGLPMPSTLAEWAEMNFDASHASFDFNPIAFVAEMAGAKAELEKLTRLADGGMSRVEMHVNTLSRAIDKADVGLTPEPIAALLREARGQVRAMKSASNEDTVRGAASRALAFVTAAVGALPA
ncbi:MAG: hypothetical protein AAF654_06020 [Myxococcota bacterium]